MSSLKSLGLISVLLVLLLSVTAVYADSSNIQISTRTPSLRINPCETAQYSFYVTNVGQNFESYEFGVKGLENYATLSTNFLVLGPGEGSQVDLFINPECSIYGTKDVSFLALAKSSGQLAKANVVLDIARNYDYSVVLADKANICNLKATPIPIFVKNNVPFVNQFDIKVNGPSWLKQEAKRVELGPYQNGITQLVAQPANPGSYVVDVTFTSARGDVVKAGSQNITVEKCYSPDLNIENPSDIIITDHSASYKVTVKNEGTRPDTYSFELNSPEWVSINANSTTLKPGETKTFTLTANPKNVTGDFKASFKLTSYQTNYVKEDLISLKVISLEDAFNLKISPQNSRVLYGQDVINVALQNNGLLPATYELVLNGPKWTKLTSNSVVLQPGEKGIAFIQTSAKTSDEEANYEMQLIANVKNEKIGFTSKFTTNLRKLTLGQEAYLFTMTYLVYIIAGAVVLIIAAFIAIFGRRIKRAWKNAKIRRNEIAKVKAELKARKKEERLARKLLKESMKKVEPSYFGRRLLGVLMILVSLIILGGIVLTITGYAPFVTELAKFQGTDNKFQPMLKIDTTGLEAYGNTIIIRGKETTIPVIISNNYNQTLVFGVETNKNWIKTDVKEVELKSGSQEKVNIIVRPDATADGLYKVSISASLEKDDKLLSEDITLNIRNQDLWHDLLSYVWYVAGGIALLILGIIIKLRYRKSGKETSFKFSKIKYKPLADTNIELPRKK